MDERIKTLFDWISDSRKLVFFGGAGVSTESGIPDFRSSEGIFRKDIGKIPPEVLISSEYFNRNPKEFYSFYKEKMLFPNAEPNTTHRYFANLERMGHNISVVTQNIDGLHQMAGSRRVWELHGSCHRNTCLGCGKKFDMQYITESKDVPRCDKCGSIIKPDVVLYGEPLDEEVVNGALFDIQNCDLLIIAGTSLSVYPAASFISYATSAKIVIINKTPTASDRLADMVLNTRLGEIFT